MFCKRELLYHSVVTLSEKWKITTSVLFPSFYLHNCFFLLELMFTFPRLTCEPKRQTAKSAKPPNRQTAKPPKAPNRQKRLCRDHASRCRPNVYCTLSDGKTQVTWLLTYILPLAYPSVRDSGQHFITL